MIAHHATPRTKSVPLVAFFIQFVAFLAGLHSLIDVYIRYDRGTLSHTHKFVRYSKLLKIIKFE